MVIEVFAPEDGVLQSILKNEGETVLSEEPIANFEPGAGTVDERSSSVVAADGTDSRSFRQSCGEENGREANLDMTGVSGSGRDGRITKEDVISALASGPAA